MRRILRRKVKRIKQDQVVMCYRDTKTNVLITWGCTPDSQVEVWFPDQEHPEVVEVQEALSRAVARSIELHGPPTDFYGWWGMAVGFFSGAVEHLLHPTDINTIEQMEKELEE